MERKCKKVCLNDCLIVLFKFGRKRQYAPSIRMHREKEERLGRDADTYSEAIEQPKSPNLVEGSGNLWESLYVAEGTNIALLASLLSRLPVYRSTGSTQSSAIPFPLFLDHQRSHCLRL